MNSYESTSMFATLAGTAIGWYFGGPIGGAVVGSLVGGLFGSAAAERKQRKQQVALAEQQIKQAELLREKVKRDNAEAFSAARSATSIQSGAMGAIY